MESNKLGYVDSMSLDDVLNEFFTPEIRAIDTQTLLAELAYRTENFSKYKLLEGKFNSFKDYDGMEWAIKLENRSK